MSATSFTPPAQSVPLTEQQLTQYITALQGVLRVAGLAASFSPNKTGANVITALEKFLTEAQSIATNSATLNVINGVIAIAQSGNLSGLLVALEQALGMTTQS